MKRPSRQDDGYYHIDGKKYRELFGSRIQVWNGNAYKTAGELTRSQLMMNKWNRIVSSKKHKTAKKEKRLQKYGYFAKKGTFGFVKRSTSKRRSVKGGSATTPTVSSSEPVAAPPTSMPSFASAPAPAP